MKTIRLAVSLLFALAANAAAQSTPDLAGLWGATRRFGPDTRGPLIVYRTPQGWRADFAGFTVPVRGDRPATFAFDLPDGKGSLRNGHWIQWGAATPVTLTPDASSPLSGTERGTGGEDVARHGHAPRQPPHFLSPNHAPGRWHAADVSPQSRAQRGMVHPGAT